VLFRKLASQSGVLELDPEWLEQYSVARYRPMRRLLSEEDYEFLATQKGYDPSIARKLRSRRRKIFRQYLRCLKRDFRRLEGAAKLLLVGCGQDRPDLAKTLFEQRLMFTFGILAVEYRLALHGLGLGNVDIRDLLGTLDRLQDQLGQLALAQQPVIL
jgi:hypothetical protein